MKLPESLFGPYDGWARSEDGMGRNNALHSALASSQPSTRLSNSLRTHEVYGDHLYLVSGLRLVGPGKFCTQISKIYDLAYSHVVCVIGPEHSNPKLRS